MQISRRGALLGASAAAVVAGVPGAVRADRLKIADIQSLVSELRNCGGDTMMAVWVALQLVADRLEALPGIAPVPDEMWQRWKPKQPELTGESLAADFERLLAGMRP